MTYKDYLKGWFKVYWTVLAYLLVLQLSVILIYKLLGKVLGYDL